MIFTVIMYRSSGYERHCSCCPAETSDSDFAICYFDSSSAATEWWATQLASQLEETQESHYCEPEFTLLIDGVPESDLSETMKAAAEAIRVAATAKGEQIHERAMNEQRAAQAEKEARKAEERRKEKEETERRQLAELQAKYGGGGDGQ